MTRLIGVFGASELGLCLLSKQHSNYALSLTLRLHLHRVLTNVFPSLGMSGYVHSRKTSYAVPPKSLPCYLGFWKDATSLDDRQFE